MTSLQLANCSMFPSRPGMLTRRQFFRQRPKTVKKLLCPTNSRVCWITNDAINRDCRDCRPGIPTTDWRALARQASPNHAHTGSLLLRAWRISALSISLLRSALRGSGRIHEWTPCWSIHSAPSCRRQAKVERAQIILNRSQPGLPRSSSSSLPVFRRTPKAGPESSGVVLTGVGMAQMTKEGQVPIYTDT